VQLAASKRYLCVWERGDGSGHLARLSVICRALLAAGCSVLLSARNPERIKTSLKIRELELDELPAYLEPQRHSYARSHAELLMMAGFANKAGFVSYLKAWQSFLARMKPAAVFCDHADGALIAATSLGIPTVVVGTAFFHPPLSTPFPSYDLGLEDSSRQTSSNEEAVLDSINNGLRATGLGAIESLSALYRCAGRMVTSFPQLDCYGIRQDVDYLGVPGLGSRVVDPAWEGSGEKAFCYFTRGRVPDDGFVKELSKGGYNLLIAAPGIHPAQNRRLQGLGVTVIDRHVDLKRVCAQCSVVFSEGNHATTSDILRYGRVPLLLPRQVEQLATALVLAKQGLGILPDLAAEQPVYLGMIEKLKSNLRFAAAVTDYQRLYSAWNANECARAIEASVHRVLKNQV
jgi:UDP:flavonoid glycosyltransferase YjiC (YdhE family)